MRICGPLRPRFPPFSRLCSIPGPIPVRVHATPRPSWVRGPALLRRRLALDRLLGRLLLAIPAPLLVGSLPLTQSLFQVLQGVLFSDGWGVCPTFEAFAKPILLCVKEAALHFNMPVTPFVPEKLLRQEVDRRGTVVDFLSSLAILFRQAASHESSPSPLLSHLTYTAIRGLLLAFQLALYS